MAEAIIYFFDAPSKKHKNGAFPVTLKVTHERKRKYYPLPHQMACLPEQWNFEAGRFNKTFPKYKAENAVLSMVEKKAQTIIHQFEREDILFTFDAFETQFLKKEDRTLLLNYMEEIIDRLQKENKPSTAAPFKQTVSSIRAFKKTANTLRLRDVTYTFLKDFEHYLRSERNCKDTSISVYMRSLRNALNQAIKDKILKSEYYPFGEYQLSERLNTSTAKRAISKETIKSIEALIFPDGSPRQFAQNIFLFSYYTRGMNFVDIAYLTPANVMADKLAYVRRKTGKPFAIGLHPKAKEIIELYLKTNQRAGGYIFPVFDDTIHVTAKQKFDRRKTVLRDINKYLKDIAKMVGMEGLKLTSYVSRHTYATVLKDGGTNVARISEALGHGSEKVTQIYLKSFGDDALDDIDKNLL